MMAGKEGFIFVMTLITMSVITLLVLTCMQHILIYHKALHAMEQQHARFYQMEAQALQLVRDHWVDKQCIEAGDDANGVMQNLVNHKGCELQIGAYRFQYLIEELGDFTCLIAYSSNKKWSTRHRRLSLLFISDKHPNALIQIRYISPIPFHTCENKEKQISLGISSWRYLAEI